MPYIPKDRAKDIKYDGSYPTTAGELNYYLTITFIDYIKTKGLNYQTINDIVGASNSAIAEFQRRIVIPYENIKWSQNGDVYDNVIVG